MNKKITGSLIVFLIATAISSSSYFYSFKKAEKIKDTYEGSLSPLHGRLIIFRNDKIKPQWVFSAEYEKLITGATFDINISLFGKVIQQPPKTNKIK